MLMNSCIAAAVLAFGAAQTGASPIAVPPPEILAENNIPFHGFDPSKWTASYPMEKREAEAQWGTANPDGSVPSSFMQAVNKWQQSKSGKDNHNNNNNNGPPNFWERDASVAANPDGTLPPNSIEALSRWESLYGFPGEKRGAVPPFGAWPGKSRPEQSQRKIKNWKAQVGHPVKAKRAADQELSVPKNPIFLTPLNGEPRPLMIQRREAEAEAGAEAEAQVFSGLPSASYFKHWQEALSKNNHMTNDKNDKRQWNAGPPPPQNNYISIPASSWAAAMKQQSSDKGGQRGSSSNKDFGQ
ncbi:hypothetical protein CERZMDRAFT_96502 [Cercospora zeae-maydis SCOH1-5]|uniref:Uncharacterized protein n=1 Tax=Cercospora zeae-maydis SCOH1-5 TaxID=717836 RepID=A0A6A6FJR2_9PEZI|nr:hypothetical protein CERZMDRAFT_96502 [Cercospora zeae-maydis SCOH1-5]